MSSAVAFRMPCKTHEFPAVRRLAVSRPAPAPPECDLRRGRPWWTVPSHDPGGCRLSSALADTLRWVLVERGRLACDEPLAPAFLELAAELTGASGHPRRRVRALLEAARRFGCARERDLATESGAGDGQRLLFARAARHRVAAYVDLGVHDLAGWRRWLWSVGPILAWRNVERGWRESGPLTVHDAAGVHAFSIVGYHADGSFIVRAGHGHAWGDAGHATVSEAYARAAFMEAYGLAV